MFIARTAAVLGLLTVLASPAHAATIYTDQTSFLADVEAGHYLETFNSLAQDTLLSSPINFSGNGFAYTTSLGPFNGGFFNEGPAGDTWLSTNNSGDSILFTFTSGNVTAVGGNFFATDITGTPSGSSVVLTLNDGTTHTLLTSSATSFVGFTSLLPILSMSFDAPDVASVQWSTANNLIVGQTAQAQAPEPATLAMLGLGALFVVRRRAATRQAL